MWRVDTITISRQQAIIKKIMDKYESGKRAEAINELLYNLRDKDFRVRANCVEALGNIGDLGTIDPLTELLHDDYSEVRIATVQAWEKWVTSES